LKKLICITGPTGSGKTKAAIQLAIHYQTEILSFDSRQFYHEMQIGTAPPSSEELNLVHHHFIHCRSIHDEYNASTYADDALSLLKKLFETHDLVIMVGGSGLYLRAVIDGFSQIPASNPIIRQALNNKLEMEGLDSLQNELLQADPIYYQQVDIYNPARLIRALEVIRDTGKPYSEALKNKSKKHHNFTPLIFMLNPRREVLYKSLNQRVDKMMQEGLVDEAKRLFPFRSAPPLQTVGYKELFMYLDGEYSLEESIDKIKQHTRNYAKRQITWFKKMQPELWPTHIQQAIERIDMFNQ